MIKGIAAGTMIDVQGGGSGTYVYGKLDGQGIGTVLYNTKTQHLDVWDGYAWQQITLSHPTVSLNSSAVSAITWAMRKMEEDAQLEELSKKHPDVIKIIFDYTHQNSMPKPVMEAIIKAAKEAGLKTVVHIGTWDNAREAALAGASAITHLWEESDIPAELWCGYPESKQ